MSTDAVPVCRLALCLLFVVALPNSVLAGHRQGHVVEVRWNDIIGAMTISDTDPTLPRQPDAGQPHPNPRILDGPTAAFFEFVPSDQVTLTMIAAPSTDEAEHAELVISYKITGTDVAAQFKDSVQKIFPATGRSVRPPDNLQQSIAVTDDLLAGGRLVAAFEKTFRRVADGKTTVQSHKEITFRVADEYPWFAATFGVAFSTARHPSVAVQKTSQIITFTKDGKPQQANQQVIALEDDDGSIKPVQTVIAFLNFDLYRWLYASAGFQVGKDAFKEPLVGVTLLRRYKSVGIAFTLGVLFSAETQIVPASGFTAGQIVDPTVGLTAGDIPTEDRYHARPMLAFSVKY